MYSIAHRSVLPPLSKGQADVLLTKVALSSLADLFEAVPDPRGAHGLRYDLPFSTSLFGHSAVAQLRWDRGGRAMVSRSRGLATGGVWVPARISTPSGSLYRWLLPQVDACAIERVLGSWVQATATAPSDEPLALDGKTLRGARSGEQTAPHLLAFVTHHSQETFWQVRVDEKTNEIPVAKQVLPTLPIGQRVCTADALHTHAEFLRLMHQLQAETVDRRRGRVEVRTIKGSHEMNAYLAPCWPFVAQVAQLTRTVTKAGKTTTEVMYLITTLSSCKASPERLLDKSRGHWSIENRSHSVRDVSFGKDRSRLRTGNAPQILAAFRTLAITLIHRFGSSHIKATRRHFASCPQEALALLSSPKGGQQ